MADIADIVAEMKALQKIITIIDKNFATSQERYKLVSDDILIRLRRVEDKVKVVEDERTKREGFTEGMDRVKQGFLTNHKMVVAAVALLGAVAFVSGLIIDSPIHKNIKKTTQSIRH